MAVNITIASELSKVTLDGSYPVTDLIGVLLQYVGITTNAFGRDVHTAAQVFHRSLTVYNGIRALIEQADQLPGAAPDWTSFDAYTSSIPELEKILLEFYEEYPDDTARDLLPPADDVHNAISFTHRWKKDRYMLKKALEDLAQNTFQNLTDDVRAKVKESRLDSRVMDDQITIQSLATFFKRNQLIDGHIIQSRQTLVSDVKALVSALGAALLKHPANDACVSIRAMLLVYIPFALISSKQPAQKVKDHLRETEIWKTMKDLLEHVIVHVQGGTSAKTVAELETLIAQLEVLLLGLSDVDVPLAEEILQLIKLGAVIRRPFHGRSVALISVLRHLDDYSRAEEHKNISIYRTYLKDVMLESITVLQVAKAAAVDVRALTLESPAYTTEKAKFDELFSTKIKKCFTDFDIGDHFGTWNNKFASGVSIDEDHFKDMRTRLGI